MNRILLFAPLALLACSQPEPVFNDANDVREAIMQVENVQFQALMNNDVEASNSHWSRDNSMQWIRSHTANDSAFDMAWNLKDAFIEDGDTTAYWSHLWANEVTYTQRDSTILTDPVDPRQQSNGNGIGNYYASLSLPTVLTDSTWWSEQVSDSLNIVLWEHVLPTRSTPEQFILTRTSIPDSTAEDFHPDSKDSKRWVFQAPHGLPVRWEESWYRGDMGYGSDMTIDWTWEGVNDPAIAEAISNWTAPEWAKEPAPVDPAVAGGGGSENWFEEAMESLPAIGDQAPVLTGLNLDGEAVSLEALNGQLVYLDFWYIGCGPCMRALPHLAGMQEEFGPEGFTVLGVNPYQDAKTVKRYLDRRELDVPQMILDSLPTEYPIVAYPTWFLIGRDGQIIDRNMGYDEDTGAFLDSLVQVNL